VTLSRSAWTILREIEAHAYDVLLIDMDRANGESWQALRALSTTGNPLPIVVLLSPEHGEPHELEVRNVRVVLCKPVSREALLRGLMLALQDVSKQS
jgi:CheY-like chemotaxis protein